MSSMFLVRIRSIKDGWQLGTKLVGDDKGHERLIECRKFLKRNTGGVDSNRFMLKSHVKMQSSYSFARLVRHFKRGSRRKFPGGL